MFSEQQQCDSEQQARAGVGIDAGDIGGAGPATGAGAGAGADVGALFGSFWSDFSFSWCLTVDSPV